MLGSVLSTGHFYEDPKIFHLEQLHVTSRGGWDSPWNLFRTLLVAESQVLISRIVINMVQLPSCSVVLILKIQPFSNSACADSLCYLGVKLMALGSATPRARSR